jgi:hypothetical protein
LELIFENTPQNLTQIIPGFKSPAWAPAERRNQASAPFPKFKIISKLKARIYTNHQCEKKQLFHDP